MSGAIKKLPLGVRVAGSANSGHVLSAEGHLVPVVRNRHDLFHTADTALRSLIGEAPLVTGYGSTWGASKDALVDHQIPGRRTPWRAPKWFEDGAALLVFSAAPEGTVRQIARHLGADTQDLSQLDHYGDPAHVHESFGRKILYSILTFYGKQMARHFLGAWAHSGKHRVQRTFSTSGEIHSFTGFEAIGADGSTMPCLLTVKPTIGGTPLYNHTGATFKRFHCPFEPLADLAHGVGDPYLAIRAAFHNFQYVSGPEFRLREVKHNARLVANSLLYGLFVLTCTKSLRFDTGIKTGLAYQLQGEHSMMPALRLASTLPEVWQLFMGGSKTRKFAMSAEKDLAVLTPEERFAIFGPALDRFARSYPDLLRITEADLKTRIDRLTPENFERAWYTFQTAPQSHAVFNELRTLRGLLLQLNLIIFQATRFGNAPFNAAMQRLPHQILAELRDHRIRYMHIAGDSRGYLAKQALKVLGGKVHKSQGFAADPIRGRELALTDQIMDGEWEQTRQGKRAG